MNQVGFVLLRDETPNTAFQPLIRITCKPLSRPPTISGDIDPNVRNRRVSMSTGRLEEFHLISYLLAALFPCTLAMISSETDLGASS